MTHQIKDFVSIPLLLVAISANWRNIYHPGTELNECPSREVRRCRRRILGTLKMHIKTERAETTIAKFVPLHRNVQISNITECEINEVFAVFLAQMGKNCLQLRCEKW